MLVFQGHIIKGESTGLGKILREVGEKNDYKMIMCCSDKQEDVGAVKAQKSAFEWGNCCEIVNTVRY